MENECDSENASDRDTYKYTPEKPLILLRISISYILLKCICGSAFKAVNMFCCFLENIDCYLQSLVCTYFCKMIESKKKIHLNISGSGRFM